jgi:hypothetical protein
MVAKQEQMAIGLGVTVDGTRAFVVVLPVLLPDGRHAMTVQQVGSQNRKGVPVSLTKDGHLHWQR